MTRLIILFTIISSISHAIRNGKQANGSEPFLKSVVGLASTEKNKDPKIFCTAFIVSENTALTAAHCLWFGPKKDRRIVFGISDDPKKSENRKITRYLMHDHWTWTPPGKMNSDLAIVEFDGGIPKGYEPIEILNDYTGLTNGTKTWIAGFGVTNSTGGTKGQLHFAQVLVKQTTAENRIGIETGISNTCRGDSGGTSIVEKNGKYYAWGVLHASNDRLCTGSVKNPFTHYIRLDAYRKWIDQKIMEAEKGI